MSNVEPNSDSSRGMGWGVEGLRKCDLELQSLSIRASGVCFASTVGPSLAQGLKNISAVSFFAFWPPWADCIMGGPRPLQDCLPVIALGHIGQLGLAAVHSPCYWEGWC